MKKNKKQNIHLLCNAHLDPVWQWDWPEAAGEALSTFRIAADFCEKHDTFIFNHNESLLYQWIEEYEPASFARIHRLVKAGKWLILGGWFLQPDCNMPSGESLIRQILVGQRYFKEKFGVDVHTAANLDVFGHSRGLVQILVKTGYDSYLFGRPSQSDCPLPGDEIMWVGYDGSEIVTVRTMDLYTHRKGKAWEKLEDYIANYADKTPVGLVLWGVGNHGGGPSVIDLQNIDKIIKTSDRNIIHSHATAYFSDLKKHKAVLPRHHGDLNPCFAGCYTSMATVKRFYRQLENDLFMAEKMAAIAAANGLIKYPNDELNETQRDMLFAQFHDALPGTSIQPVEKTLINMLGHGIDIAARVKAKAFFAMANCQKPAMKNSLPIFVFNPHPFAIKQTVECELTLSDWQRDGRYTDIDVHANGNLLPCQTEKPLGNIKMDNRKRVVFWAELKPNQMNRFDCVPRVIDSKPAHTLKTSKNTIAFTNKTATVAINKNTGLMDGYEVQGRSYLAKNAFELLVIRDTADPWGMKQTSFTEVAGKFKLLSSRKAMEFSGINEKIDSVRIIEDGPVRSVIEAVFGFNNSFACQRYILSKSDAEIEVQLRVYWNEKDSMLKLAIPMSDTGYNVLSQDIFGTKNIPQSEHECVGQKWLSLTLKQKNTAFTCINDGTYGFDCNNDTLRVSLLRSPAYCGCPVDGQKYITPHDRFTSRLDQGEHTFRFWCNAGSLKNRIERIDREAMTKNETPYALTYFPAGPAKPTKPIIAIGDNSIQVTAIKQAHDNDNIICRLFESTGRGCATKVRFPIINKQLLVKLKPFEIKTYKIILKSKRVVEERILI